MAYDPTINSGARGTAQENLLNGINSRRGFSVDYKIGELEPNETPFVSTLMGYKRKSVNDPDHKYLEHRPAWLDNRKVYSTTTVACSATYAGKAFTSWTIDDGDGAPPDYFTKSAEEPYVLQVVDTDDTSKYCNFLVTAVTDTGETTATISVVQLTDKPGFNVADNDPIYIIGTAFDEGGNKTTAYSDIVSVKWASCQIFKTSVKASRTTMKTWTAGGDEWDRLQREALKTHKVDMERNFLFGSRAIGNATTAAASTANNPFGAPVATQLGGTTAKPVRTSISIQQAARWADEVGMGGCRLFNNTEADYKYANFLDDMEELFEFCSDSRYFFGGQGVLTILTKMALDTSTNLTSEQGVNEAGVKYTKFMTPHGDLKFVRHKLFRGVYAKKAFAVDMNNIDLMVFDGTFIREDVQTPGYDGQENEIISDMGLIINLPEATVAEFNWQ
jgi:hypothetical protein